MNTIEEQRDYITTYYQQRAKFEMLLGSMASDNSAFGGNDINGIKLDIDSFREKFKNIILIDPNANKTSEILDQLNQQIREYKLKLGIKEKINISNSTEKSEGFGDRLLSHFDQKYELEKCIEQEISNPNSVFATNNIVGIDKFYDKLKIEFADLVKGNQVIERVLNSLCYEVPQFYDRKKAYEQNPTQLVRKVLAEHLQNLEFDPNIIDQLENLDKITVSFDKPPTIVISTDSQLNIQLLHFGNIDRLKTTISVSGFHSIQPNLQFIFDNDHKYNFKQTLEHEHYHKKTFTQADRDIYDFDSQKPEEFMESGHLGFEELLACFISEDNFGAKAKFKTYLPDDINPNDCNNIKLTIEKTQTALHKLRLAYMKYKGLSDTEAREKIGCGFRNHYTQGGGRIMKTSNIPKIVDSMILAMQGQIREEYKLKNKLQETEQAEQPKEKITEPVSISAEEIETQKPSLLARLKAKLRKLSDKIDTDSYT